MKLCKCGICIDDCDYHKPEPTEWWKFVGLAPAPDWKLPKDFVLVEIDFNAKD